MTAPRPRWPDAGGHFGPYGGRYVPETLMEPLRELEEVWTAARADPGFQEELRRLLVEYVGRPTPLGHAARLSERLGVRVLLKREDLCHTGAHKINNALGQALLVRRMGKRRVVAETGAGQHGVATATACALLGLECVVYMGSEDMARQAPNVERMRLLGAEVRGVDAGQRTLKDAINEAMRDWVTNVRTTHYLLGSVLGAHPYPAMVRDLQAVIGEEARRPRSSSGRDGFPISSWPAWAGAPTPSGSSTPSSTTRRSTMVGVEAGGRSPRPGDHAARFLVGDDGEARPAPASGSSRAPARTSSRTPPATSSRPTRSPPAWTTPRSAPSTRSSTTRAGSDYASVTDDEALAAFHLLGETEGILPALESSHALAWLVREAAGPGRPPGPREPQRTRGQGPGDRRRAATAEEGPHEQAPERQGQQPLRADRRVLAGGARGPHRPRGGDDRHRRGREDRGEGRPLRPGHPVLRERGDRPSTRPGPASATWCAPACT